jgi:hypothetical protein
LANLMLGRNPEQRGREQSPWLQVTARPEWPHCSGLGCPRNKQKICWFQPKQTETRSVSRNQKQKILVCFSVLNLYRNNGNKQNCFETNRNNPKFSEEKKKICSLSNCFGWSSVCFGSIETLKLFVSV